MKKLLIFLLIAACAIWGLTTNVVWLKVLLCLVAGFFLRLGWIQDMKNKAENTLKAHGENY